MGRRAVVTGCLLALGSGLLMGGVCLAQQQFSVEELCRRNYQTGLEFHRNQRFTDARESFTAVVEACPDHVEAHRMLGNVALSLQDFEQAIESFSRVRSLEPENVDVMESLAYAYSVSARIDEAEELYQRVLELDPYRTGAMQNLAFIFKNQGKLTQALMLDQQAFIMTADPDDLDPPEPIARDFLTAKVYSQALHLYNARYARDEADLASARILAFFYYRVGHNERAVQTYEAVLEAEPESPTALSERQILADALKRLKRFDDALVHMEYVLQMQPDVMNNYYNMAAMYNESGRFDRAISIADRGLARNPGWSGLHYVKAEAFEGRGNKALEAKQFADAIAHYEQALATFQRAVGDAQFGGHASRQVTRQEALIDRARKIRDQEATQ